MHGVSAAYADQTHSRTSATPHAKVTLAHPPSSPLLPFSALKFLSFEKPQVVLPSMAS